MWLIAAAIRSLAISPVYSSAFVAITAHDSRNSGTRLLLSRGQSNLGDLDDAVGALPSSSSSINNGSSSGTVAVSIKRKFPNATPLEARDAWIEHHWKKGGGLPIFILSTSEKYNSSNIVTTDEDFRSGENDTDDETVLLLTRNILPVFMKEQLLLVPHSHGEGTDSAASLELHYEVTESGPFYADVIPGSHSAVVTFDSMPIIPQNEQSAKGTKVGCEMTWNVTFSTTKWTSFYETMTQLTVGTASSTVQESIALPRRFSARTTIDASNTNCNYNLDPIVARKECLEFVWVQGGGLPLIPPIPYGKVLKEGAGTARQNLLRIPPFLTESIVGATEAEGMADFEYQLINPGWYTFPFLVHTHFGRVTFTSIGPSDANDDTKPSLLISWDVEIRHYASLFPAPIIVEKLVEMIVSTLLRNTRVRLMEPGATVIVQPPRGNSNLLFGSGRDDLGTIAKDSWLGGVLSAHLSDKRSTMEQSLSLFRPWSWGRSGMGDEADYVHFNWSDGYCD